MDEMGVGIVHILDKCGENFSVIHFLFLTEAYKQFSTKFGHLIPRKISKLVATRCHILRLKCTKINFGWGLQRSPRPHNWI